MRPKYRILGAIISKSGWGRGGHAENWGENRHVEGKSGKIDIMGDKEEKEH